MAKPERKCSLGRPERTCADNINMGPLPIDWSVVGWIGLAQYRDKWSVLVNAAMILRDP